MYQSVILPAAKEDIRSAAKWYNEKQNGLGRRFTQLIRKKLSFIERNPEASVNRNKNVRTANLDVFPFLIHYQIDDEREQIVVLAVFHTSLNPEKWNR